MISGTTSFLPEFTANLNEVSIQFKDNPVFGLCSSIFKEGSHTSALTIRSLSEFPLSCPLSSLSNSMLFFDCDICGVKDALFWDTYIEYKLGIYIK